MLVIRYATVGRKNHKQYRIVVQEKTKAPTGRHVAVVGSYDPHTKEAVLKTDEITDWISKGAQPSDSVYNLLVRKDVIKGDKRAVKLPDKKEEVAEEEAPKEEKADEKAGEKDDAPADDKADDKAEEKTDDKKEV